MSWSVVKCPRTFAATWSSGSAASPGPSRNASTPQNSGRRALPKSSWSPGGSTKDTAARSRAPSCGPASPRRPRRKRAAVRSAAPSMRALMSELVGTALLLAAVVGSGIMGERLAGGNVAVALLANTLATGAVLVALILTFGAISGAHFNPVVSFADASQGGLTWTQATAYSVAQCLGAVTGVAAADYMFGEPLFAWSRNIRTG